MSLPDPSGWLACACHCGAVRWEVRLSDGYANASRCDCSFCRRKGTIAVTAPRDGIRFVAGEEMQTLYTFGTHTAQHHFCRVCGIYTYHNRRSDPDEIGVNVACIKGVNPRDLGEVEWHDGVNHPSDR